MKRKDFYLEIITWLLFILFIYTASDKLIHYKQTTSSMNNQPFDNKYTPLLVFGIPLAEYIVAALLISKRTLFIGLCSFLTLMLLFTGYIILIKINYYGRIPCSCGGVISSMNWTQHFFFNLFFILLAMCGIWIYQKPASHA